MMALSDLGRSCHLRNEQCGTNTIKENICSENIKPRRQRATTEELLKRRHDYY